MSVAESVGLREVVGELVRLKVFEFFASSKIFMLSLQSKVSEKKSIVIQ